MTSIWQPGTGSNIPTVDSDNSYKTQRYIATQGQTDFTLTEFAYAVGTNSLDIIINGVTQTPIKDFVEVTGNIFRLVEGAEAGDDIYVRGLIGSEGAQSAAVSAIQAAASATLAQQQAAAIVGKNNIFIATSTTPNTIGLFALGFDVGTGKQFQAGQYIMASVIGNSNVYMVGRVTSYSGSVLLVLFEKTRGSGTYNNWNISITGEPQPLPNIFTDYTLLAQAYATTLAML